jgi:hypothetical protein
MTAMRSHFACALALVLSCVSGGRAAFAEQPNTLSEEEKRAGFTLIFNGENFDDWQQKGNWKVVDGAMYRATKGGGAMYLGQKVPDNFELRFEWKVAKGSNSGIYYRPGQYEYQILDNQASPYGRNPRTSAGALYFCMAPSKDVTKPAGEWNTGRIVAKNTVIQHWLNGEKVIDFDYTDPRWKYEVGLLELRGADLLKRGSYLQLQDHGDPVWYRGLKLREIPLDEDIHHATVTPAEIPAAELAKEKAFIDRVKKQRGK